MVDDWLIGHELPGERARQLAHKVVLDRGFINQRFADHGGLKRLDAVLGNHRDEVLGAFNDSLWRAS